MHRILRMRTHLGALLLALIVIGVGDHGAAQEGGPRGSALIVPIGGTVRLQMTTKKPIRTVVNPVENAVNIRVVVGDPTTILITGQQPAVTRIELTDEDGKKETYEVIVQLDIEYLKTQLKRAVPTANITPIPTSTNTVILQGTVARPEDVDVVLKVVASIGGIQAINALRVGGVHQVQLDVTVVEVAREEFRRMAFDWLLDSKNFFFGNTTGGAVIEPSATGVGAPLTVAGRLTGNPGTPGGDTTNLLFGVLHNSWGFLGFLQALRDENLVKLLAEPKLVTLSGRPASFLVGGQQAIPVPAGLGQVGVEFVDFGTQLNFLPIVLGNGKIHLEVEPQISNLDPTAGTSINGTVVPGRSTNRVSTTVQLESGQTFVIGGLIQRQVTASTRKVPVLGDLPFLGTFFSAKSYDERDTELLVLVTPHLVDAEDCSQIPKILPGQETRSPDDFELFLEGILEAPRGQRQPFQGHRYVPAYKNGPTADKFPCYNNGSGYGGYGSGCGVEGSGQAPNGGSANGGYPNGGYPNPNYSGGGGYPADGGNSLPPPYPLNGNQGAAPDGKQGTRSPMLPMPGLDAPPR
jgi:pilus assembly protein CpaC